MIFGYTYHYAKGLSFIPRNADRSHARITADDPAAAAVVAKKALAGHLETADQIFRRGRVRTIMIVPYPETEDADEFVDFLIDNPSCEFDFKSLAPTY